MNDTLDLSALPFYLWDTATAPSAEPAEEEYAGVAMLDSVFAPRPMTEVQQRPSLFMGHSLSVEHNGLQPLTQGMAAPWTFAVLAVLTALLCTYFRLHKLRISDLLTAIVDSRAMERTLRGNNLTRTVQLVPMALMMLAAGALTVHSLLLDGIGQYLLLTLALTTAYLLRNSIMRLLGVIFDNSGAVALYITSNYLYHLVLASALIPMLFLYFYLPHGHDAMLTIIGIVTGLEFIMRLFRGIKLFLTHSSGSQFYLFYYLCIIEMTPILVLTKYFIS